MFYLNQLLYFFKLPKLVGTFFYLSIFKLSTSFFFKPTRSGLAANFDVPLPVTFSKYEFVEYLDKSILTLIYQSNGLHSLGKYQVIFM